MKRLNLDGLTAAELEQLRLAIDRQISRLAAKPRRSPIQRAAIISQVTQLMADGMSQRSACERANVPTASFLAWKKKAL